MPSERHRTSRVETCLVDGCEGILFFWSDEIDAKSVMADCCTCTQRYELRGGQLEPRREVIVPELV